MEYLDAPSNNFLTIICCYKKYILFIFNSSDGISDISLSQNTNKTDKSEIYGCCTIIILKVHQVGEGDNLINTFHDDVMTKYFFCGTRHEKIKQKKKLEILL